MEKIRLARIDHMRFDFKVLILQRLYLFFTENTRESN